MFFIQNKYIKIKILSNVSIVKSDFQQVFAQYLDTKLFDWFCADGSHINTNIQTQYSWFHFYDWQNDATHRQGII